MSEFEEDEVKIEVRKQGRITDKKLTLYANCSQRLYDVVFGNTFDIDILSDIEPDSIITSKDVTYTFLSNKKFNIVKVGKGKVSIQGTLLDKSCGTIKLLRENGEKVTVQNYDFVSQASTNNSKIILTKSSPDMDPRVMGYLIKFVTWNPIMKLFVDPINDESAIRLEARIVNDRIRPIGPVHMQLVHVPSEEGQGSPRVSRYSKRDEDSAPEESVVEGNNFVSKYDIGMKVIGPGETIFEISRMKFKSKLVYEHVIGKSNNDSKIVTMMNTENVTLPGGKIQLYSTTTGSYLGETYKRTTFGDWVKIKLGYSDISISSVTTDSSSMSSMMDTKTTLLNVNNTLDREVFIEIILDRNLYYNYQSADPMPETRNGKIYWGVMAAKGKSEKTFIVNYKKGVKL